MAEKNITIEEAEKRKKELQEEIKKLSKFISQARTKNALKNLEYNKYYKYINGIITTYFQYTEGCKYNESELCGATLTVDKYIIKELSMMYHTVSFGNHGTIFIDDQCLFEEITEEKFKEIFKYAAAECEEIIK